jgi:hypothetical protein
VGDKCIQINHPCQSFGQLLSYTRVNQPRIAMANEDSIVQVLVFDDLTNILDMYFKSRLWGGEMYSLAKPGQRGGIYFVTLLS